ncbi:hypothetical protein [Cytobacillus purgationiresistens]|uniref:Uncharacterized protein n=1 Tax=Cytobacillus purgationiresistens TaxID=863449 RepID=A0ABU0AN72_9BACI|nr:hypothetical protein [Cytobacillus purgationiresistens]MDQ0272731.1 hypothetical protein [Cytobacillus purgationiresistens]
MLKQCNEEDFYQLRSVARGRLRPPKVLSFSWGAFFFSGAMTSVVALGVYGSDYRLLSSWLLLANICIAILIVQFIITLFFTKESNAYRFQKVQSVFLSIIAFKLSLDMYVSFIVFSEAEYIPDYLRPAAFILCMGGLIYLVLSTIRGIKRVQQGEFRQDGKGLYNIKQSKTFYSLPIIFGATMMAGVIARTLSESSSTLGQSAAVFFILFLAVVLQYALAFALPEFFLLTYCKFRFESFHVPMPSRPLKETPRETLMAKKQAQQVKTSKKGNQKKKARGKK